MDVDDEEENNMQVGMVGSQELVVSRRGKLQSPSVQLSGHGAAVLSLSFSACGEYLATADGDGKIFLWEVFGSNNNYNVLNGHKNACLQVKWLGKSSIVSCSADNTLMLWDANKGERIRKFCDHTSIVNCCSTGESSSSSENNNVFVSAGDDCSVLVWDSRAKNHVLAIDSDYPVLACQMTGSQTGSLQGSQVYFAGIQNHIFGYDLRNVSESSLSLPLVLDGHSDSVTGLALSPIDERRLLSNSMDGSLIAWDTKPFVMERIDGSKLNPRIEKIFEGSSHGQDKSLLRCAFSNDGEYLACGASDRVLRVWNYSSQRMTHFLTGHKGIINDVAFHPKENIVASCSTDKTIILGEL